MSNTWKGEIVNKQLSKIVNKKRHYHVSDISLINWSQSISNLSEHGRHSPLTSWNVCYQLNHVCDLPVRVVSVSGMIKAMIKGDVTFGSGTSKYLKNRRTRNDDYLMIFILSREKSTILLSSKGWFFYEKASIWEVFSVKMH